MPEAAVCWRWEPQFCQSSREENPETQTLRQVGCWVWASGRRASLPLEHIDFRWHLCHPFLELYRHFATEDARELVQHSRAHTRAHTHTHTHTHQYSLPLSFWLISFMFCNCLGHNRLIIFITKDRTYLSRGKITETHESEKKSGHALGNKSMRYSWNTF